MATKQDGTKRIRRTYTKKEKPVETVETVDETKKGELSREELKSRASRSTFPPQEWVSPVSCPNCKRGGSFIAGMGSYFAGNIRVRKHQCKYCEQKFISKEKI